MIGGFHLLDTSPYARERLEDKYGRTAKSTWCLLEQNGCATPRSARIGNCGPACWLPRPEGVPESVGGEQRSGSSYATYFLSETAS